MTWPVSSGGRPPRALSIAGSDSGGGAGIQADLAVFFALGVHGATAVTAVTSQNTEGIRRIDAVPPEGIEAQIEAVLSDIGAGAIKIGMLGNESGIRAVARALDRHPGIPIVLDPVLNSTGGVPLLERSGERALVEDLLPLVSLLTPNLHEAAALLGQEAPAGSSDAARDVCSRLAARGPRAILLKGGHGSGDVVQDWLWTRESFRIFEHPRREVSPHGTGCALSAAIAAHLARGLGLEEATQQSIEYVLRAIDRARRMGRGAPILGFHE